jgi:hypothetical protein
MTINEAIEAYEKQFPDGFPYRQFGNQKSAVAAIETALDTGEPIKTP